MGENLGSFFRLFSLTSSALDHSATAPPLSWTHDKKSAKSSTDDDRLYDLNHRYLMAHFSLQIKV